MAIQRGRSERRGEAYFGSYVEPLSDARTKLVDFFTILQDGSHEATATWTSSFVAEEEGVPSLAARQVLHTRGRALRNDTLPLARQL